jgi:uncharacterized protein YutE (UPF0331/DUF86 family)
MLDKNRILSKLDELNSYLVELEEVMPKNYEGYVNSIEKKRSCERLLHISVECVIDVCSLMVKGLRLGLPSGEEDLFERLERKKIISGRMKEKLKLMRGFRNVLVHRYGEVDDELVFENLKSIEDFKDFSKEVTSFLKTGKN